MRRPQTLLAVGTALVMSTAADLAHACPVCAQKEYDGVGMSIAIAAMIVVPYVVVISIIRFIKNGEGSDVMSQTAITPDGLPPNHGDNA